MIDKSTPSLPLTYYKTDPDRHSDAPLPEGYEFVFYRDGDEVHWAEIEMSVGQFDSLEKGLNTFSKEFLGNQSLDLRERMLFVKAPDGEYVATCTLWNGDFLGEDRQRLHWLAIKDSHSGRGLAKALLCRLLTLYCDLGYTDRFVYLLTSSRYYPAIHLYRRLGFTEYLGPKSLSRSLSDEDFVAEAFKAKAIVDEKLSAIR